MYKLQKSHCSDKQERTLFFTISHITFALLLHDLNTFCIMDHLRLLKLVAAMCSHTLRDFTSCQLEFLLQWFLFWVPCCHTRWSLAFSSTHDAIEIRRIMYLSTLGRFRTPNPVTSTHRATRHDRLDEFWISKFDTLMHWISSTERRTQIWENISS